MRIGKLCSLLAAAAIATAGLITVAGPAGAATTCSISEYPALPGGQSGVVTACTVAAPAPTTLVYHDFAPASGTNAGAVWHFGSARTTTADGHTTAASKTISAADGNFNARDINHTITGGSIPVGSYITSVTGTTTATISAAATATSTTATFKIENSPNRSFKDGVTTSGSGTVTSATANFQAGDVGSFISGQGLKPGTKITARTSTTQVTVSPVADGSSSTLCSGTSGKCQLTVETPVEPTTTRRITDGHTTTGSTTVTSASALFGASDAGTSISGAGIPANTIISAFVSATQVTINHAATASSTAAVLVIGSPTFTAPTSGQQVLQIGAELQLNPALVSTSDSCSEGTPEGFVIDGVWENPANFNTANTTLGAPVTNSIAQVLVTTPVINFAGYVVQKASNKYDVNFPLVPTGLADCSGATIGSTFRFDGITLNQSSLPTGSGTAGSSQVRAIRNFPNATASQATSASVTLGATTVTASCTVGRQINAPSFACGNG